ncbi:MAG: CPBP family intramembrane metalloprotease [Micromonosporaceae bacterium]|nr:CPBP family intramembrane metalloprotease [Micromonosporaceae bacterium]
MPGTLTRREEAAELGVFLLLILPTLVLSFVDTGASAVSFPLVASATIARDVGLVALILLLIARDRQPVAAIGWVRRHIGRDILIGLALSVLLVIGAQVLEAVLRAAGLSSPSSAPGLAPSGLGEVILAVVLVVVVAVAEETIFRGYLILRFAGVFRSRLSAVVASSLIFAIGHGYEGGAAVVTIGLTGLVFAIVYIWRQSLVAPVVMHLVFNLLAIVVAPLLSS